MGREVSFILMVRTERGIGAYLGKAEAQPGMVAALHILRWCFKTHWIPFHFLQRTRNAIGNGIQAIVKSWF